MLEPGKVYKLQVVRKAPFGFFLSDGEEDVLLHQSDIQEELAIGQEVNVFIYQDHLSRPLASLIIPTVQVGRYDWVKVVGVNRSLGVFVDIGLKKDILVSKDDLPNSFDLWPTTGDRLFCSLTIDKKQRLFGKLATVEIMKSMMKKADQRVFNETVTGVVISLIYTAGSLVMTDENWLGFIHESEQPFFPRLGQEVKGRVIHVKEDGTINISLIPRNYERLDEDAQKILDYLKQRGGSMPYWDKSHPEDIKMRFNMSKGAFKRALGALMKKSQVIQRDGWTIIHDKIDKE